jgi:hypothetical protein
MRLQLRTRRSDVRAFVYSHVPCHAFGYLLLIHVCAFINNPTIERQDQTVTTRGDLDQYSTSKLSLSLSLSLSKTLVMRHDGAV